MKSNIIEIDPSIIEVFDNKEEMLVIQGGIGVKDVIDYLKDLLGSNTGYCANNCNCTNPKC